MSHSTMLNNLCIAHTDHTGILYAMLDESVAKDKLRYKLECLLAAIRTCLRAPDTPTHARVKSNSTINKRVLFVQGLLQ